MTKRGRPVTHPKIENVTTGKVYSTYTEAAQAIDGSRFGVMRTCWRMQKHHHGYVFRFKK